jgi:hypothetical protein
MWFSGVGVSISVPRGDRRLQPSGELGSVTSMGAHDLSVSFRTVCGMSERRFRRTRPKLLGTQLLRNITRPDGDSPPTSSLTQCPRRCSGSDQSNDTAPTTRPDAARRPLGAADAVDLSGPVYGWNAGRGNFKKPVLTSCRGVSSCAGIVYRLPSLLTPSCRGRREHRRRGGQTVVSDPPVDGAQCGRTTRRPYRRRHPPHPRDVGVPQLAERSARSCDREVWTGCRPRWSDGEAHRRAR